MYDHIVEQSQIGRGGFTPEEVNSPFNMNPVDSQVNQLKGRCRSRPGSTTRWKRSLVAQRRAGLNRSTSTVNVLTPPARRSPKASDGQRCC